MRWWKVKTMKLVIGSSEEILNALLKTDVQKVCGRRAIVKCTRVARVDEFISAACDEDFDLAIFIAPGNLLSDPQQPLDASSLDGAVRVVRTIKSRRSCPILAISPEPEWGPALGEAGVDCFLVLPVNPADLESAISRCLGGVLGKGVDEAVAEEAGWIQERPLVLRAH